MSVYDIHEGKRTVIVDETVTGRSNDKILCIILAKSIDPGKYESVMHIQKGYDDGKGSIEPIRGGVMIDTNLLPDVKRAVDKIYLIAVNEGLIESE